MCRECAQIPEEERREIEVEDELFGFLKQSHISAKNVARLRVLAASGNKKIAELADIVLEVAQVKPYKRLRLKVLARERKDLLRRLEETGLIQDRHSCTAGPEGRIL